MEKLTVKKAINYLKENDKRNFSQSFDLIVNLRDINLKNPEEQLDFFLSLTNGLGKKVKVAALVGQELSEGAKVCDKVIKETDFEGIEKKEAKKIANEYDFFIGQADIMPKIAMAFGRVLGPRGKMPNPKLGTILPGKASVEPVYDKLQKTVRVTAKKTPNVQVKIGNESLEDAKLEENLMQVFNQIMLNLPKERSNIKRVLLKKTMSKPVELDL
ncbi:MAG: 50S ribosomal protein L1 [Candidatus Woesearchaeota archaeon]